MNNLSYTLGGENNKIDPCSDIHLTNLFSIENWFFHHKKYQSYTVTKPQHNLGGTILNPQQLSQFLIDSTRDLIFKNITWTRS